MKKVLFIGNSFSVGTATYMHQIAKAMGEDLYVAVLYIGGCSIQKHYHHIINNTKEYDIYVNGDKNALMYNATIFDGLNLQEQWDIISYQQWSYNSCDANSYFPELTLLSEKVKELKDAQFVLNETWSYAKDYRHEKYGENPMDQQAMTKDVINAYHEVSKKTGFPLFPVGEYIAKAREVFGDILNRDGFHLSELGRVLAGLVWCYQLFGKKELKYYPNTGKSYDDITPGISEQDWQKLIDLFK